MIQEGEEKSEISERDKRGEKGVKSRSEETGDLFYKIMLYFIM